MLSDFQKESKKDVVIFISQWENFSIFIVFAKNKLEDDILPVTNPDPEVRSSRSVYNGASYCSTRPNFWIRICHCI
jgi:hypothetical protein